MNRTYSTEFARSNKRKPQIQRNFVESALYLVQNSGAVIARGRTLLLQDVESRSVPASLQMNELMAGPVAFETERGPPAVTNFFGWYDVDEFDWLAAILLNPPGRDYRIFIAPRPVVDARAHYAAFRRGRSFTVKNIGRKLADYEDNFGLVYEGTLRG